jgi:hypothetical protein
LPLAIHHDRGDLNDAVMPKRKQTSRFDIDDCYRTKKLQSLHADPVAKFCVSN